MSEPKLIIGLSGRKGSGKDTACGQLVLMLWQEQMEMMGWSILSFAQPIKEFAINVMGLTREQVWGTDKQKNTLTPYQWENLPGSIQGIRLTDVELQDKQYWEKRYGQMTAREVMQVFGTDIMRAWHNSIWAECGIRRALESASSLVLFSDVRFPNECEAIRNTGGKVIRLLRSPFMDSHKSENALDDYTDWDHIVPDGLTIAEQGENLKPIVIGWFKEALECK